MNLDVNQGLHEELLMVQHVKHEKAAVVASKQADSGWAHQVNVLRRMLPAVDVCLCADRSESS